MYLNVSSLYKIIATKPTNFVKYILRNIYTSHRRPVLQLHFYKGIIILQISLEDHFSRRKKMVDVACTAWVVKQKLQPFMLSFVWSILKWQILSNTFSIKLFSSCATMRTEKHNLQIILLYYFTNLNCVNNTAVSVTLNQRVFFPFLSVKSGFLSKCSTQSGIRVEIKIPSFIIVCLLHRRG